MNEENKFKLVDTIKLYRANKGHVELWDASYSNESEEQRIHTVTTIASLAYGNDQAKNPENLYETLKKVKHHSLWEFIREGAKTEYLLPMFDVPNTSDISGSMRNYFDDMEEYQYSLSTQHRENVACFKIKVPIFVARQFIRHRAFSYLELSRRYTKEGKVDFEFWFPKSMSADEVVDAEFDLTMVYNRYKDVYAPQVSSRFLPQTTYTEFYVMGEYEGLANFFNLRLAKDAQDEIRVVAKAMLDLLEKHQVELYAKIQSINN